MSNDGAKRVRDGLDPALGSALDEQLGATRPDDADLLARVKARVMNAVTAGSRITNAWDAGGDWRELTAHVQQKVLWRDGEIGAFLLRCAPGAVLPPHVHRFAEECLVLEGTLRIGPDLLLRKGDFLVEPEGTRHDASRTDTGALVFLRGAIAF